MKLDIMVLLIEVK